MSEEWRLVAGWPGYEISSLGRLGSWRKSPNEKTLPRERRILKGGNTDFGYRRAVLTRESDGRRESKLLMRMVAEAFIGPKPSGMVMTHLDGNKHNDSAANLAWRTQRENIHDKIRHGTMPRGEENGHAKLTADQVRKIRTSSKSGAALAREYGVRPCTISGIIKRRTWAWLSDSEVA